MAWPTPPTSGVAFQIYYYADQIYMSAGVNSHDVQYVTVGTGAVNVVVTVLAVSTLRRSTRRLARVEGVLRVGFLPRQGAWV